MKLLFLLLLSFSLHAEPIEFIIASSAGGPDDTVVRKLIKVIEQNSDLVIVPINKPGAAHQIGYSYISQSKRPTLVHATDEILDNDVYKEITELYYLGDFNNTLFVDSKSDIRSMNDLTKKKIVLFGHAGEGSYSFKTMQHLCKTMNCLPVPYKSGAEGMLAILQGTIDTYALVSYGSRAFVENDRYRVIGHVKFKNWVKLFSKNLSDKDRETITRILKNTDEKFYNEMGFTK